MNNTTGIWRVEYCTVGLAAMWHVQYFNSENEAQEWCRVRHSAWGWHPDHVALDPEFVTVFELIQQGVTRVDQ